MNNHGGFGRWAYLNVTDPFIAESTIRGQVEAIARQGDGSASRGLDVLRTGIPRRCAYLGMTVVWWVARLGVLRTGGWKCFPRRFIASL